MKVGVIMDEIGDLVKKFELVGVNDIKISTDEKPIIGTQSLASCVGVLLYSKKHHKAIVGHFSDDVSSFEQKIGAIVTINDLDQDRNIVNYAIVPGYYHNGYNLGDTIKNFLDSYPETFRPFDSGEVSMNLTYREVENESHQFAFNAETGKVIDAVILEEMLNVVNDKEIVNTGKMR